MSDKPMHVDITLAGLRSIAMTAHNRAKNQAQVMVRDAPRIDIDYVQAMALVQIAQELNEIKHILRNRMPND